MKAFCNQGVFRAIPLLAALIMALAGCGPRSNEPSGQAEEPDLGPTIGSVAEVVMPPSMPVSGFGLVGNLAGTGSANCPPQVRGYLRRYILAQLPDQSVDVDELINSNTTAVVVLQGVIPSLASKGEHFDVQVSLIPGSETTSLRGGWLYKAEMRPQSPGGSATRPLATAEGPIFMNLLSSADPNLTPTWVLGGGHTLNDYSAIISLPQRDYTLASAIRNRLSERYGDNVAAAISPRRVEYVVPPDYARRKARFVALVGATYLNETPELIRARVDWFVGQLASGRNAEHSEIALEAIGRECVGSVAGLLGSPDEQTRLRAARIMLDLRDDEALATLRQIALDPLSEYRLQAMKTVAVAARRNDASSLMRLLLRDPDMHIVVAAYEYLRDMGDPAVTQDFIGRSFYLERVVQTNHKAIFVARRGDPRVVIFGAPLACRDDVFIESPGGAVIIDARPGQGYMTLVRKNPMRPGVIGPIKTGYVLSEVIRALGSEATSTGEGQVSGLGVSYAEVIALLEQMCDRGVVAAEFWPGPLPEIEQTVKK